MMSNLIFDEVIINLRKAESIYNRVAELSEQIYIEKNIKDRDSYLKELQFLLQGVKGSDAHLTIFNHKTYSPELEVGHVEFWGPLPDGTKEERMVTILGLLNKEYSQFPYESVNWFTAVLNSIPYEDRVNMKIHHCGMRFTRMDGKPICIFSQGIPMQFDKERNFNHTLNYVQNVHYLIKKDFPYYWIRVVYGEEMQHVKAFHSAKGETPHADLLSAREKEILVLIAKDMDTREIAEQLFISPNTVGNHRSNMIERLGARDTTALLQLAKMVGII